MYMVAFKVSQVCQDADRLCRDRHFEKDNIRARKVALMERRQKLKKSAEHRRHKLEDCRKYNIFLQDIMEVICSCVHVHMNGYLY